MSTSPMRFLSEPSLRTRRLHIQHNRRGKERASPIRGIRPIRHSRRSKERASTGDSLVHDVDVICNAPAMQLVHCPVSVLKSRLHQNPLHLRGQLEAPVGTQQQQTSRRCNIAQTTVCAVANCSMPTCTSLTVLEDRKGLSHKLCDGRGRGQVGGVAQGNW